MTASFAGGQEEAGGEQEWKGVDSSRWMAIYQRETDPKNLRFMVQLTTHRLACTAALRQRNRPRRRAVCLLAPPFLPNRDIVSQKSLTFPFKLISMQT